MFSEWATRWGIPQAAIDELHQQIIGNAEMARHGAIGTSEERVQASVRYQAAQFGRMILWRNNVGAMLDPKSGRMVRYGLANDSKAMNNRTKSSDLIGIGPGGLFTARECKPVGWRYMATDRERAQLNFLEIVVALGGDGKFTTGNLF